MSRYTVIGASGFIGSRLVAALRARGEAVVVALPGESGEGRRRLVATGGTWHVEEN